MKFSDTEKVYGIRKNDSLDGQMWHEVHMALQKQGGWQLLKTRGVTSDLWLNSFLNHSTETIRIVLDTMNLSHDLQTERLVFE